MPIQKRSLNNKISIYIKVFFRNYPLLQYGIKWLCISIVLGLIIGTASAGFLISLNWATQFRESHTPIIIFLPLAGLCIGLLYHYYGKSVTAGNNMVIDAIHNPRNIIPFRMAPLIYISTVVTHLFGGSAGREGTAIQIAASLAHTTGKLFALKSLEKRNLVIMAAAAGFGSVFGTPLAGAVFGLEFYYIGKMRYKGLLPAFAASIIADAVTRAWQAPHTHYHIPFVPALSIDTILYSIAAGIAFGFCAQLFSKTMHYTTAQFKKYIAYEPLRPFIGGIIICVFVYLLGTTRYIGLGIPVIQDAFNGELPAYDFALKIAFTIVTLSAGFKGGEVTPLFFIGATLGNALSLFIPLPMGLLAGMGFVAVFAGAANTPLACIFMAMELFGTNSGIYAAIACTVAYLVSGRKGIYSSQVIEATTGIK